MHFSAVVWVVIRAIMQLMLKLLNLTKLYHNEEIHHTNFRVNCKTSLVSYQLGCLAILVVNKSISLIKSRYS